MSFYAAGAWWVGSNAFGSQAEADAFEKSGGAEADGGSNAFAQAMGRPTAVKAPTGRANPATGQTPASIAQQQQATNQAAQGRQNLLNSGQKQVTQAPGQWSPASTEASRTSLGPGNFFKDAFNDTLDIGAAAYNNPFLNPVGAAAKGAGNFIDSKVGANVSGYIQDPVGQGLHDIGAPDLVQAAANPTGYIARNIVNADTGYGTNVPQIAKNAFQGIGNISADAGVAAGIAKQVPGAVANAATTVGRGIANAFKPTTTTGGSGGYQPVPTVTPSMTPQQVIGSAPRTARPSSAQQDAIVNQMLGQANVQSGYQDFNSPQYNQSRSAAMGYTGQLAGLANSNNVAITGLDGGQYNQSRGLMQNSYGALGGQANNNVADIQANSGQRDSSRADLMQTAQQLNAAAYNDVQRIDASQGLRAGANGAIVTAENQLMGGKMNDVGDIQANRTAYNGSAQTERNMISDLNGAAQQARDPNALSTVNYNEDRAQANQQATELAAMARTAAPVPGNDLIAAIRQLQQQSGQAQPVDAQGNDIIAKLVAASQRPEGPSAAESLMMNAQERATRNAIGNGASMGGGWRSQLTNSRAAMGQAAAQQADIAAQMGALRANEAATFRGQSIDALGQAGGLSSAQGQRALDYRNQSLAGLGTAAGLYGDIDQRELDYRGQSLGAMANAGQLSNQISQNDLAMGQQDIDYRGQSLGAMANAGQLQGNMSGREANLAQSDAALLAQIRQGNQANTTQSRIAAGQLGLGRLNSDTSVAISDADRAMLAAQGNQQNRVNALGVSGGLQSNAMVSDTNLAQSNASLLAQIRQGNQANSLASLQSQAGVAGAMNSNDLGFATNDASIRTQRELANQQNRLQSLQGAASAANQTAGMDANIGMNNSNNRVTVDQNNRANSIAALQNAGVLSSQTRAQDVQLSVQDSQALTSTIVAAAGLSGTQYAAQLQSIAATADRNQRQQQWEAMQARLPPADLQRIISTAGPALGVLGLLI